MLWLVVPTYNERENINELMKRLLGLSADFQILVVDDASPDGTGDAVERWCQSSSRVHLLRRTAKSGLGSAYREGFRYTLDRGATAVGEMDADLSHAPEDVPRLVAALAAGADVVVGSRRVAGGAIEGWSMWRRLTSWGATTLSRLVLGLSVHDVTAGFRLYGRSFLERTPWEQVTSNGYAWQEETLCLAERARLTVVEVPVVFNDRTRGRSKLSLMDVVEFFRTLLRLRFGAPWVR
jgi:dolichol-phosphate mannosyltransferase